MLWGLALEDAIARAYTVETGRPVRKVPMRRAKHVRAFPMIGSIDRLAMEPGAPRLVELKTARSDRDFAPVESWRDLPPERRVPADYYVQVQHYLEVADVEIADVAALFGGSDFRIYELPRDRDFGADLRSELASFWHGNVLARVEPEATALDLPGIRSRYPSTGESEIVATPEIALLVRERLDLAEKISALEKTRDDRDAKIREFLGDAKRMLVDGASVYSFDVTRTGWKELAASYRRGLELYSRISNLDVRRNIQIFRPEDLDELGELETLVANLETIESLYKTTSRTVRVDRKEGSE
jgi:predicted phage-related endonuclease